VFCDNEVAIGIAADTVSQRMSKVTDMRLPALDLGSGTGYATPRTLSCPFHPRSTVYNVADFFTKPLPVARHRVLASFIAADPANDDSTIALNNLSNRLLVFYLLGCFASY
jgi:hypothetical protein